MTSSFVQITVNQGVTLAVTLILMALTIPCSAADGNVFIATWNGGKILEYSSTGTFIRTLTTGGAAGTFFPYDLTFGADGMLYAANNRGNLEKFNPNTGAYLGSVGTIPLAAFGPLGITLGPDHDLYVTTQQALIYKVDPVTNATTLIPSAHQIPWDLAFRPNDGVLLGTFGSQNKVIDALSGAAVANGFILFKGLAFGKDGRLYCADQNNIRVISGYGVNETATNFTSPNSVKNAQYLAFALSGNLYVTSFNDHKVDVFNNTGSLISSFTTSVSGVPTGGYGVAVQNIAAPEPGTLALVGCMILPYVSRRNKIKR